MNTTDTVAAAGRPPIPPKVASAISAVMKAVPKLGKDDKNQHGGYNFASIDVFLAVVGRLCADAGLVIAQDEDSFEIVQGTDKNGKPQPWLRVSYRFTLAHSSGETWEHSPVRSIMVLASMGPQAFGAAQSYALKQFERSLFQIATGDGEDADNHAQSNLPNARGGKQQEKKPAWRGPMQTTELKQSMRALSERMNGGTLGTTGDFEAVKEEYAAIIEQAKHDLPDWHEGFEQTARRLQSTLMVGPASAADPDNPASYEAAQ